MKKFARKATAVAMAAAMVFGSTPVFAAEEQMSTDVNEVEGKTELIDGEATVVNPVFRVTLPTEMPFAIDAFLIMGGTTAITSSDYAIVNRSNVPVKVEAKFDVTTASGVQEVTYLGKTSTGVTQAPKTKQVSLALVYANGLDATKGGVITSDSTVPAWIYKTAEDDVDLPLSNTTEQTFNFMLDRAVYTSASGYAEMSSASHAVLPEFNAAGFKLVGDATAYPQTTTGAASIWEEGDAVVSAKFLISGMRRTDYLVTLADATVTGANPVADTQNIFSTIVNKTGSLPALPADGEGTDGTALAAGSFAATTLAVAAANAAAPADVTIPKTVEADDDQIVYYKVVTTAIADGGSPATDVPGLSWRTQIENGVDGWTLTPKSTSTDDAPTVSVVGSDASTKAFADDDIVQVFYAICNAKHEVINTKIVDIVVTVS